MAVPMPPMLSRLFMLNYFTSKFLFWGSSILLLAPIIFTFVLRSPATTGTSTDTSVFLPGLLVASEFSRKVAELIKKLPANERNKLKDQMTRARRSITNNLAEGYGRFHYQENIQYCRQSRGSICEIIYDLIECRDENYI